jgi:hypothetical protein
MTIMGVVEQGVIVLEPGSKLPEGTRVKIVPEPATTTESPTFLDLLEFAGCMPDLPADFAQQHDHYIHGTPKK